MASHSRPLSPHIQVYKPQITSLLSITHRVSGIALSIGSVLLVWQLLAAAAGPEPFASIQSFLGSWLGLLLLVAWSAALYFHLFNGVRHLAWDLGYGFDLPSAYRTGNWVLLASAVLTALTWLGALVAWR